MFGLSLFFIVFQSFSHLVINFDSHDSDYVTRIFVASHQIRKSSDVAGYLRSWYPSRAFFTRSGPETFCGCTRVYRKPENWVEKAREVNQTLRFRFGSFLGFLMISLKSLYRSDTSLLLPEGLASVGVCFCIFQRAFRAYESLVDCHYSTRLFVANHPDTFSTDTEMDTSNPCG